MDFADVMFNTRREDWSFRQSTDDTGIIRHRASGRSYLIYRSWSSGELVFLPERDQSFEDIFRSGFASTGIYVPLDSWLCGKLLSMFPSAFRCVFPHG